MEQKLEKKKKAAEQKKKRNSSGSWDERKKKEKIPSNFNSSKEKIFLPGGSRSTTITAPRHSPRRWKVSALQTCNGTPLSPIPTSQGGLPNTSIHLSKTIKGEFWETTARSRTSVTSAFNSSSNHTINGPRSLA